MIAPKTFVAVSDINRSAFIKRMCITNKGKLGIHNVDKMAAVNWSQHHKAHIVTTLDFDPSAEKRYLVHTHNAEAVNETIIETHAFRLIADVQDFIKSAPVV